MTSNHKPFRLGLLTTLNTNIGDDFIREGLLSVVRDLIGSDHLKCEAVNKHKPNTVYPVWHPIRHLYAKGIIQRPKLRFLRKPIERWVPPLGFSRFHNCDLILQCGTPILWEGCRNSEWAILIWRDVLAQLQRIRRPVLNLGGGSCYGWEKLPTTLLGSEDEEFVRLMLNAASVTTVRDRLSQQLFATLGFQTPRICCPAILAGQAFAKPAVATRKVVLNYMKGGGHFDFGQSINAQEWEETMRSFIIRLKQDGWEPVFLAHNQQEEKLAARIWPDLPRVCPAGIAEYFEVVRQAAFGVFNRMHASVAAAGLGVPSVAIGNDSRNLMVEALGLPALYTKDATVGRLWDSIQSLISNHDAESRRLLELRHKTFEQYKEILRPYLPAADA